MLWPTGGVDLQYYKAIFSTKSFTNSMWISVSKTVIATAVSYTHLDVYKRQGAKSGARCGLFTGSPFKTRCTAV